MNGRNWGMTLILSDCGCAQIFWWNLAPNGSFSVVPPCQLGITELWKIFRYSTQNMWAPTSSISGSGSVTRALVCTMIQMGVVLNLYNNIFIIINILNFCFLLNRNFSLMICMYWNVISHCKQCVQLDTRWGRGWFSVFFSVFFSRKCNHQFSHSPHNWLYDLFVSHVLDEYLSVSLSFHYHFGNFREFWQKIRINMKIC